MGEFDVIHRYFSQHRHVQRQDIVCSVGDDCAVLEVPTDCQLAISTDTLVCGTHFLENISPEDLAYKSLAVNFSDLAAQGAKPAWISLALTLPNIDHSWLAKFSQRFFQTLSQHQTILIGGDTTKGPLSLTLTAYGFLPKTKGLFRSRANIGDAIFVSGTLGDSAAGLTLLLNQQIAQNADQHYLLERHLRPTPRIQLGQALLPYASSALDISDGLLADLQHILHSSQCGAEIHIEKLPLSTAIQNSHSPQQAEIFALSGGEDYELCFTVPEKHIEQIHQIAYQLNIPCTQIGKITATNTLKTLKYNQPYQTPNQFGFDHFNAL